MGVRLIAVTDPRIEACSNADELIAYCARVSNPTNQSNKETAPKLIGYLVRNQHWSPFEMAHMVLEITTTRDIARQILRHRSFSFQEFSQRYAPVRNADVIFRETRLQDIKNRQASLETDDLELIDWWLNAQADVSKLTNKKYREALERGIAKEIARVVLPEGMTESTLYMAGVVRSWIHYCQLRCTSGTQKEHREIALQCRKILLEEFPALAEVL
jgi:thymidylate synthase (FAD)